MGLRLNKIGENNQPAVSKTSKYNEGQKQLKKGWHMSFPGGVAASMGVARFLPKISKIANDLIENDHLHHLPGHMDPI